MLKLRLEDQYIQTWMQGRVLNTEFKRIFLVLKITSFEPHLTTGQLESSFD